MPLLRTLRIRNLVIVEDLTIEFGPGLNLLTGETGAGKSILVDALGLVAGARADRSLVRAGCDKASVEALFDVPPACAAAAWIADNSAAQDVAGQLLVLREIAIEGSGRIVVNGSPCTLGLLRELVHLLLELHGQDDPKNLLETDRHLAILDGFGGLLERERVGLAHAAVRAAAAELDELRAREADRASLGERLRRTAREIEELRPRAGELELLDRERCILRNASRMVELLEQAIEAGYEGEPSAAALSARAAARVEELSELDPSLSDPARRLRAAAVELADVGAAIRDYRDRADFDPARLEQVEARRAALERACLAHATDEAGLIGLGQAAAAELAALESIEQERVAAEARELAAQEGYLAAADSLGRARASAALELEQAVERQFRALALGQARFKVELLPARGATIRGSGKHAPLPLGAAGAERAEFLLAANPGEPLRALRQVASGGELARVMLALHVAAGSDDGGRVVVFDEIDAGVGGAVADAVGARLRALAATRQLLCVTHLPQVAAYADRHFRVLKSVSGGRTHAGVADLCGAERIEELARMLAGRRPTPTSRKHAAELLEAAGRSARQRSRA